MNIKRTVHWAAFALIALVAVWAVYLLLIGLPVTRFPESLPGQPLPPGQTVFQPYPAALYALLALAPAAIGLLHEKWLRLAWASVVLLLLFGFLLIFSIGVYLIVAAALLALLLAALHRVG